MCSTHEPSEGSSLKSVIFISVFAAADNHETEIEYFNAQATMVSHEKSRRVKNIWAKPEKIIINV